MSNENQNLSNQENIQPINMDAVDIFEINKEINFDTFESDIEEERKKVYANYKKSKLVSNIIMGVVVAFIIAGIIMWTQNNDILKILGYVFLGLGVVTVLVFYVFNRNKTPQMIRKYMGLVSDKFNAFVYHDEKFRHASMNPNEKMDAATISADRCYVGVASCGSRNVVKGKFMDHPFIVSDVSCSGLDEKNKQVDLFVGKYLSFDNNYKFDGRIIINVCLKGDKVYDLPNDTFELEKVFHENQMTIWANPGLDYKGVVNDKFLSILKQIKVAEDKHLVNMNIVIWGGHSAVYLSYDNSLMSFPFEHPFTKKPIEQFKKDQDVIFELFELMLKEKTLKTDKVIKTSDDGLNKESEE